MADDIEDGFDPNVIREALYGNAFSEGTEKCGRNLLLIATVTLITAVFDVAVKSTPLVPLDFSKQPNSLIIFLAITNFALLISYILRALNDLLRANEDWAYAKKFIEIEHIRRARDSARAREEAEFSAEKRAREDNFIEEYWEEYEEAYDKHLARVRKIEAKLGNRMVPVFVRWIRLFFFGGLPILIGIAALIHTWENAFNFFQAVVGL